MGNIKKIGQVLDECGLDALIITSPAGRQYATGFPSTAGIVVVTRQQGYFFVDSRYIEAAGKAITDAHVEEAGRENEYFDKINQVIERHGVKTAGFEDKSLTVFRYDNFVEHLSVKLKPAQDILTSLRAVKSREELDIMIAAQRIAEKALDEVLGMITTDMTESDVAAELVYRMMKNGAQDKSFDPIVVTGEKSSMPHGVPADVKLKKGFMTIDFGAKLGGYCSDMTRTYCIGKPTEEMKKVYSIVLEAQATGIAAAKAGVPGCDIDGAARKVIEDAGYGQYFGHSFGHSLGLEIHEAPNAAPSWPDPIPAGAVISAEPGIYLPGRFGVRIEDVLYITEDGNIDITKTGKELTII